MQTATRWYHFIAYFFGGAFLANTIPHLVSGISGSPFQGPFASPPGQGLSSPTVNVLSGMFNLVGGNQRGWVSLSWHKLRIKDSRPSYVPLYIPRLAFPVSIETTSDAIARPYLDRSHVCP